MQCTDAFTIALFASCLLASSSATDCVVNQWEGWSSCRGSCKRATQIRNRSVLRPVLPSDVEFLSNPCPHLYEIRSCTLQHCISGLSSSTIISADPDPQVPCDLTTWDAWGPCEGLCPSGWQVRNRAVVRPYIPPVGPFRNPCPHLYEVKACDILSCNANNDSGSFFDQHLADRSKVIISPPGKTNSDELRSPSAGLDAQSAFHAPGTDVEETTNLSSAIFEMISADLATTDDVPSAASVTFDSWKAITLPLKATTTTTTPSNLIDNMARSVEGNPTDDNGNIQLNQRTTQHIPAWANAIFEKPLGLLRAPTFDATPTPAPSIDTKRPIAFEEGIRRALPPPPPPTRSEQEDIVACQVSEWQTWSRCKEPCTSAWQVRNRDVVNPPLTKEGILINLCPHLYQVRICTIEECMQAKNASRKEEEFVPENERILRLLNNDSSSTPIPLTVLFQKKDKPDQQTGQFTQQTSSSPSDGSKSPSNYTVLQAQFEDMNSAERTLMSVNSPNVDDTLIEGSGSGSSSSHNVTFFDIINGTVWWNASFSEKKNTTELAAAVLRQALTPSNVSANNLESNVESSSTNEYPDYYTDAQLPEETTTSFLLSNMLRKAEFAASRNFPEKCRKFASDEQCTTGVKPQLVIRWFRYPGFVECSTYLYPYCGVDQEIIDDPIKFEEDCYNTCYTEEEKRTLPLFRKLRFRDGFRCD